MNKVNMFRFSIMMMIFVVLLSSCTYADEATGSGTKEDPYIINLSAAATKVTVSYEEFPFYFKVTSDMLYEIDCDVSNKVVTFLGTSSIIQNQDGTTNQKVMLTKEEFIKTNHHQLGVTPVIEEGAGVAMPLHDIKEVVRFTSQSDEYTTMDCTFEFIDGEGTNFYYIIEKETQLSNAVVNATVAGNGSRGNQYAFITSKKLEEINKLFKPIFYDISSSGIVIDKHNKYDINEGAFNGYAEEAGYGIFWTSRVDTFIYHFMTTVSPNSTEDIFEVMYCFNGTTNTALDDKRNEATSIEELITRMIIGFGDIFMNKMVYEVAGPHLSIDSLIFNTYEGTKIDLYNSGTTSTINRVLIDVVNNWFEIFMRIVRICYCILIVYMGIMIILSSGTSKQGKAKEYFGYLISGLVILAFVPKYGFRLLFNFNDALVKYVGKDVVPFETYYNIYEQGNDILGSDSATVSIEDLIEMREDAQGQLAELVAQLKQVIDSVKLGIINDIALEYGGFIDQNDLVALDGLLDSWYNDFKEKLKVSSDLEQVKVEMKSIIKDKIIAVKQGRDYTVSVVFADCLYNSLFGTGGKFERLLSVYEEKYNIELKIEVINKLIEIKQKDIMGMMRAYAGIYHRIIFAVIWIVLVFQLIGLAFLYYKRLLMVGILIAIFPIVMLFYCIDKIADGTSQTLKMWFKEFLSNIFVQTIHAVIYTVLVQIGMEIFVKDTSNWIFLVAAMLFILPAESLLKEIFSLNGSTLGQIGGSFGKMIATGTALKGFASAWQKSNDKDFQNKLKSKGDRLQRAQDRADTLKARRDARGVRGVNGKAGKVSRAAFDKLYDVNKSIRNFKAKAIPVVENSKRVAKNVTAIAAGAAVAAAGGDTESLAQGAAIAHGIAGGTKKIGKGEDKVKIALKSAYANKSKNNKKKP